MIKCYIIDDEQPAIKILENYLKKFPTIELVGTSTNPLLGIEEVKKNKVELVFLDIQMDEMNGIEVVEHIDPKTKVIFCTAYSEFAVKSYELNAVDYLMKPIAFERFEKAIQRLIGTQIEKNEKEIPNDYLFVKTGQKGKMVKIDFNDISYIEGRSNYIAFHILHRVILSHTSLRDMETYLPKNMFMRVHKSYIVALNKIVAIENNEIRLTGSSTSIPLSVSYKDAFLTRLVKI